MTKAKKKNIAGKNTEDGRERIDPDHLPDIDAVYGAEQRLQDVAQHHRREEDEECLPKRGFDTVVFPLKT